MRNGKDVPCSCGSGLPSAKCCARPIRDAGQPFPAGSVMDELKAEIGTQEFASLDELNAFIDRRMDERNRKPRDDFHGLSPEQMHRFLSFPFDSPAMVTFPPSPEGATETPVMELFAMLAEGVGEQGMKATATGNLSRAFCRQAALTHLGEEEYQAWHGPGGLRSEVEFHSLHVTRLVAGLAGLIRKRKGVFVASRQCRKLVSEKKSASIYPILFRTFAEKYNWAYREFFPSVAIIQDSFLFTLYLLKKYGHQWLPKVFYEDCFLQAYPMVLENAPPDEGPFSTEKLLRSLYSVRSLRGFAEFFGLAQFDHGTGGRYSSEFRVRKLPLLDRVVEFHF